MMALMRSRREVVVHVGVAAGDVVLWRGSRGFTPDDLALVTATARAFPALSRAELAKTLCEILPWKAPNGHLRDEACLLFLAHLERTEGLVLPPLEPRAPQRPSTGWGEPPPRPNVHAALRDVKPVTVEPVPHAEQRLWNAMIDAYHPLGFRRAFGAHQRYWVYGQVEGTRLILGGLLFAAAAKALDPRDRFIGWDVATRNRFRHHIVANSRFLLIPGVAVTHLASFVLARALSRLRADYRLRYGYAPALVETFVEPPWHGTCYRAAGFVPLGATQGRGRQDRHHRRAVAVKEVLVRPLGRNWRSHLVREDRPDMEAWDDA